MPLCLVPCLGGGFGQLRTNLFQGVRALLFLVEAFNKERENDDPNLTKQLMQSVVQRNLWL